MGHIKVAPEDRFIKYVKETPTCWEWIGGRCNGYGMFTAIKPYRERAHRWLWEYCFGSIPKGKFLCHTCDNPTCVRPAHLYIGTAQTNANDREERGHGGKSSGGRGVQAPYKIKLKDELHVNRLYISGISVVDIAKQYKVNPTTIYRHLNKSKQ